MRFVGRREDAIVSPTGTGRCQVVRRSSPDSDRGKKFIAHRRPLTVGLMMELFDEGDEV